ncbi:polyphosphate:AMP phosphotransferase [Marinospirillum alkaliphilum DSM 21637]|uniref:Polyphosphate:AMP phosphotransferase n=2 Tax=Marinospirillum TaxID=64968 RepID=A0A1K1X7W2_9GAMM|nr:polyphosphate:AMP phosphotransferase [Marinospirillum alkaliphilum DSM 21637]
MFEAAELGRTLDKDIYKKELPDLRAELLQIQQELLGCNFPVLVLISGVDGAGKGEMVNQLHEWMDPRHLETTAFDAPTDEEKERPHFWRYWRALPPKGKIGIHFSSWYSDPITQKVEGKIADHDLEAYLSRINILEKMLVDDGVLLIKLWLHLGKKHYKERIKSLAADPKTAWRVTQKNIDNIKVYDSFREVAEITLTQTSTGQAPWIIVEGYDANYRSLTVGRLLRDMIRKRMDTDPRVLVSPGMDWSSKAVDKTTLLDFVDLEKSLGKKEYLEQLTHYQAHLSELARKAHKNKISTVMALEGWDAAGKGGMIRRIIHALDARHYRVIPVAAPTDEEKARHYLWRFWRHLQRGGHFTIFDRTWYGRVLVERIEGYAREDEWIRAYQEINEFEEELTEHGIVLMKYWLHIDKDEQLARFKAREQISYKQHKITDEDYRNRERWDDYAMAIADMVERTSTRHAPWDIIEGNDKRYARVRALQLLCERLEKVL